MPQYVYGCDNKLHPRQEVTHGINEKPDVHCEKCKRRMHKIPQPFRFGFNPFDIWRDWADDNYRRVKSGKKPVNKYTINRPIPLSQKDFHTRRYRNVKQTDGK